ncbi:MAG: inositol monophosphatase [Pseudomonadota bacterium]|uniref:inositol monophosphatase family protein n=1 Tax=Thalassococcus sp. TaxID=1928858 RepID=UPI001B1601EA|nr:inositol monophosphatase [Thalassococcus sp.]MBO6866739.1 inositol monophosphatase [Thalassococcus sp.]MEE3361818.1 inositol monophosphatase [Pseudomonadota bacterium]
MSETLPATVTAPLSNAQKTQILNLVRRAAKAEILPRFRNLGTHQIDQKSGPQDLVTEADKAAEAMIARGLQIMFPHALIVGEEHASDNPDVIKDIAGAELCFTIDPVDGTWNYANGLTVFGVMVAILRYGQPVFGLLYDPVMNDVIMADHTSPAEMVLPRRIRREVKVSDGGDIANLTGSVPLYLLPEDKREQAAVTLTKFQRCTMFRCACHEFRLLVQGNIDFVLFGKMTPWDQPAGVAVLRQAGGYAAMLDGSDYRGDMTEGYLLCAPNKETWDKLRDVFAFLLETPEEKAIAAE